MAICFAILIIFVSAGWIKADDGQLTSYCSYSPCCNSNPSPPYTTAEQTTCPGNSECDDDSACQYEGQLEFCGTQSHQWIIENNITSFYSTNGDIDTYKNKRLRVTQGDNSIDVLVCDTCSDSDCNGCCTQNAGDSGYLIDMEANTYQRFGGDDGDVTWTCLNC